ncbi:NUDIX domain-containing protein [Patescibacteria group bacterium]|nr:NUDIX domain-containing protein [Patescibacteria group bacterium]
MAATLIRTKAYCFIVKGEAVLLTEDERSPGWKLPGGGLKKGETICQGLLREVVEEVNFVVQPTGLVQIQEYKNKKDKPTLRFYFVGQWQSGDLKLAIGEVKKAKWFSRLELASLKQEDFWYEPYYQAVQAYLQGVYYPLDLLKELNINKEEDEI